jgi:hypothetical protein
MEFVVHIEICGKCAHAHKKICMSLQVGEYEYVKPKKEGKFVVKIPHDSGVLRDAHCCQHTSFHSLLG